MHAYLTYLHGRHGGAGSYSGTPIGAYSYLSCMVQVVTTFGVIAYIIVVNDLITEVVYIFNMTIKYKMVHKM